MVAVYGEDNPPGQLVIRQARLAYNVETYEWIPRYTNLKTHVCTEKDVAIFG